MVERVEIRNDDSVVYTVEPQGGGNLKDASFKIQSIQILTELLFKKLKEKKIFLILKIYLLLKNLT